MSECPSCGAGLETPLGCHACGVLLSPAEELSPFEVFGIPFAYAVDRADLEARLLRFSRTVHPDFFATASADQRQLAERSSARLNDAFEILADDFRRAQWIVKILGGPSESDEREMPQEFLLEVLEWSESLDDARAATAGSGERAALATLEAELGERRAQSLDAIAASLTPTPAAGAESLRATRKLLNAIRYLDRTLGQLEELRLERAPSG